MILDDDPEIDAVIRAMAVELQRPVRVRPDLSSRVMAEVRRSPLERATRWVVRPRTVTISPLGVLATAAGIVGLFFISRFVAPPAVVTQADAITFAYYAPSASQVALVGEFNDWDPTATPLRPSEERVGVWTVDVPLTPGRHEYAFLVDGAQWTPDPAAAQGPRGEFGEPNSVLTVAGS